MRVAEPGHKRGSFSGVWEEGRQGRDTAEALTRERQTESEGRKGKRGEGRGWGSLGIPVFLKIGGGRRNVRNGERKGFNGYHYHNMVFKN